MAARPGVQGNRHLHVLFHNVENLFHPSDDPENPDDDAYTPNGEKGWSYFRYRRKLKELFKTIAAIGKGRTPAIMGFAELEERRVLEDLLRITPLDEEWNCILHYPSPDHRGIDVGMIVRKDRFRPRYVERIRVELRDRGGSPTREMLYVKGLTPDSNALHVFLAHWPSRWGGRVRSEWKRVRAAEILKEKLDSIENADPDPAILVMGDLNDTPLDRSVREVLEAGRFWGEAEGTPWYDLMAELPDAKGTYFHQGHWSYLDHFLVPARMMQKGSDCSFQAIKPKVHDLPWLLKERRGEGKEEQIPYRSFAGPAYIGGISDHLPVSLGLREKDR